MLRESRPSNPSGDSATDDLGCCKELRIFFLSRQLEAGHAWRERKTENGFDWLCVMHICQTCHRTRRVYLGVRFLSTQKQGRECIFGRYLSVLAVATPARELK